MRLSRKKAETKDEETSYWLSYSDMMAALLLVFVLIISFTMLQAKKQYEQKEKELQEQQTKMEEQQSLMESQKELYIQQQEVMKQQQDQLDKIVGVRLEIVEALKEEFEDTDLKVSVDSKTGAITFDSSVLFDSGQSSLKKGGKLCLLR